MGLWIQSWINNYQIFGSKTKGEGTATKTRNHVLLECIEQKGNLEDNQSYGRKSLFKLVDAASCNFRSYLSKVDISISNVDQRCRLQGLCFWVQAISFQNPYFTYVKLILHLSLWEIKTLHLGHNTKAVFWLWSYRLSKPDTPSYLDWRWTWGGIYQMEMNTT